MLFDEQIDPQERNQAKPKRCRSCVHMLTHEYNRGFKYCRKQRSARTGNGFKKIKANDPACRLFEEKAK